MPDPEPDLVIVLRPLPDAVPADRRLRRALKVLWRVHRLRCLSVRDVKPGAPVIVTPPDGPPDAPAVVEGRP